MILNRNFTLSEKVGNPTKVGKMASLQHIIKCNYVKRNLNDDYSYITYRQ